MENTQPESLIADRTESENPLVSNPDIKSDTQWKKAFKWFNPVAKWCSLLIKPVVVRQKVYKRISKVLVLLQRWFNCLDKRLTDNAFNPNSDKLEDMTATDSAEKVEAYEEYLFWALRKRNIKNIALTGPYGSGKSSIIKTFQKHYPGFRWLNISLAKFDENYKNDDDWRLKVEISIMQQFFYHVKNSKLPDSRFKKINRTTRVQRIFATLCWLIFGIAFSLVFKPLFFNRFTFWGNIKGNMKDGIYLTSLVLIILGCAFALYKLYRVLRKVRFNKVSISGELELSQNDDGSIFNKHLDEIIYFFEVTKFDVVVIEDIDRIQDPEIFTKLREINYLINNSRQVNWDVKFLYALRDNMFTNEDRAKFFDFIIPVIPVINTSNSVNILFRKLKDTNISKRFLQAIFLYIDDMRTLVNIVNEYKLYRKVIGENLDHEKMLAIIVYKNLNPKEFEDLHEYKKGEIYEVFERKNSFINTLIKRNEEEIAEAENEIKKNEELITNQLDQLRAIYIYKILEKLPPGHYPVVGNSYATFSSLNNEEFLKTVRNSKAISVGFYQGYQLHRTTVPISFPEIEREANPDYSYDEVRQRVSNGPESVIENLKKKIDTIKRQNALYRRSTLKEIIAQSGRFDFPEKTQSNPLLIYLIRHGYIDETYPSYISHFYEGSITLNDRQFILSLLNQVPLPFDARIDTPNQIADSLYINHYKQLAIMNMAYLNWLITDTEKYQTELHEIITFLLENKSLAFEFLDNSIGSDSLQSFFLNALLPNWPEFWDHLVTDLKASQERLDRSFLALIRHCKPRHIQRLDGNGRLSKYLAGSTAPFEHEDFLAISNQLIALLTNLPVKFHRIKYSVKAKDIFNQVYANNWYSLNLDNVREILAYFDAGEKIISKLNISSYTTVIHSKAEKLKEYIQSNIADFVHHLILESNTNTKESAEAIIQLLNFPEDQLSPNEKASIIIQQDEKIPDIQKVPQHVWNILFENKKVIASWSNIMHYFECTNDFSNHVVNFLNDLENVAQLPSLKSSPMVSSDGGTFSLITVLLENDALSGASFRALLDRVEFKLSGLALSQLSQPKISALVDENKLIFSISDMIQIENVAPLKLPTYIANNFEQLENGEDFVLKAASYHILIKSEEFNEEQKIFFVSNVREENVDESHELGSAIIDFYLQNEEALDLLKSHLILYLLHCNYPSEVRLNLLLKSAKYLSDDELIRGISYLEKPLESILPGKKIQVKIKNNPDYEQIVLLLDSRNIISSFKIKKDDLIIYHKRNGGRKQ